MKFLEKDLEQIIWESDNDKLQNKGLEDFENLSCDWLGDHLKKYRQLRIGNYGIADLVYIKTSMDPCEKDIKKPIGFDNVIWHDDVNVKILELKRDKVSVSALMQGARYAKGVKRYVEQFRPKYIGGLSIEICIIGKTIDLDSSLVYCADLFDTGDVTISLYTYDYGIDGIEFKEHKGYSLNKEGFKL